MFFSENGFLGVESTGLVPEDRPRPLGYGSKGVDKGSCNDKLDNFTKE